MIRLIKTDRLIIRNFRPDDWRALQQIVLSFQASPFAAYDHPWPTTDSEIQGICNWFSTGDAYLAVCLDGVAEPVGYIALSPSEDGCGFDLGYCFHSDVHGKGYATEACKAVIQYAFAEKGADRLTSGTAAANTPSCRLLSRLGFRITGESPVSFFTGPDGEPIVFTGYSFELRREEWNTVAK